MGKRGKECKNRVKIASTVIWIIIVGIGIIILHLFCWVFIADSFTIPTKSMKPTLIPGDKILVNKLLFGARLYCNFNFSDHALLESRRIPGLRKIKPNDIIVFNFPFGYHNRNKIEFKINYVYCKRVIGTPGDTIRIDNSFYKNNCYQKTIGKEKEQIKLQNFPDSLLIKSNCYTTFPKQLHICWTIKEFGPLYIPAMGDTITLTKDNWIIYKLVIEYETGKKLNIEGDNLYLSKKQIHYYIFTKNYYFVGGDNVLDSLDSRYFGFVPEDFIVGIVTRIIYSRSKETNSLRWNRMCKRVPFL